MEQQSQDNDRIALERFVYDNPELERLETLLDDFNPFAALRWMHQELRHSACLRWLFDPAETHGLGPYYLGAFWKTIAHRSRDLGKDSPSVVAIDSWDLAKATVLCEWHGIDVLVRDDTNRFIGVLENKISTSEHTDQLRRYRELVERQFPSYRQLFAYLMAEGDTPSDERYARLDYSDVATLVEETVRRKSDQLSEDVRRFLTHYVDMVRRHIVEDSELQALSRVIYEKHRRALDIIFEHRPDRASEIKDLLLAAIDSHDSLAPDHSSKAYIRFLPKSMYFLPRVGDGWTRSQRLLLFEFGNHNNTLSLKLTLGPGESDARDRIHSLIAQHPEAFNKARSTLYPKWWTCYKEHWLGRGQYEELEVSELEGKINDHFERFLRDTLPRMEEALAGLRTGA